MKSTRARGLARACLPALLALSGAAMADDTVDFDRPGLGFGSNVLPRGGFIWEQGLPSFERDHLAGGERDTQYSADTLLRLGLGGDWELQLATTPWQWQRTRAADGESIERGFGDTTLGIKRALPSSSDDFSWALLASYGLRSGAKAVRPERHAVSAGLDTQWDLGQDRNISLYGNFSRDDDGHGWLLSPSYGYALSSDWNGYVEAAIGTGDQLHRALGTGLTFSPTDALQLDVSVLRGLAPGQGSWQAGLGVSWRFR